MTGAPSSDAGKLVAGRTVAIARLRFLCVDKNAYMRRIYRAILQGMNARDIHLAEDGAAALEDFRNFGADIVVCDWDLPFINGLDLTRQLRDKKISRDPFVPIVMCTAYADRARVMTARDAGVTEFLVKPISAKSLYQRILNVIINPRSFVETATFFGPDRRRFKAYDEHGPAHNANQNRRAGDEPAAHHSKYAEIEKVPEVA